MAASRMPGRLRMTRPWRLDGATSVTTMEIGGTPYLFVASVYDDGVQVFSVGSDGGLTDAGQVSDDATLKLDGARSVTTMEVDGASYLFVASEGDGRCAGVHYWLRRQPGRCRADK